MAEKIKEVIGSAAKSGKFGETFALVELIPSGTEGEAQFASDVTFATARLENSGGRREERIVVKRPQSVALVRQMTHSDAQFHNEHVMYSEVLPYLERDGVVKDLFPRAIHTHATFGENFEDDIVVVEDLRPQGFRLTKEKVFLDYDHCALALESLGRFHALSYVKKEEDMEGFLKTAGRLKDVRFGDGEDEAGKRFLVNAVQRGVLPLLEAGEHVELLTEFLKRLQEPDVLMEELKATTGPLAVICHGDFNRNNIFFKYDGDGRPTAVKLFDVATSRYASPAVDLAFFLTMNTRSEVRSAHWEDLLRVYQEALSSTAPHSQVPSLDQVRGEMRKMAVYGYIICSFFIPMMMDDAGKSEIEEFSSIPPEVMEEMARSRGGERCTNILTDIVRDLIKFECL